MEHLFLQRVGDKEQILAFLSELKECSPAELVDRYNSTQKLGFVGSHAQAQKVIALHHAFMAQFNASPISITNNSLLRLTGSIALHGNEWKYCADSKSE